MTHQEIKEHIFRIIQIGDKSDLPSRVFDYIISALILGVTCISFALTFDISDTARAVLTAAELVITVLFAMEYILRLWTSEFLYSDHALLRFIFSFYGLIDLLTIVSFFIPTYSGFVALRLVRVMRILRLFRVNSQFDAFNVIAIVIKNKRKQLMSGIMILFMLMLMASLSMYSFEHEAQPDVFTNGFSGIWWAVSAILTVGYGDIYPITPGGRVLGIIISLIGVCAVAIPTGIVSAGFVEYYTKYNKAIDPELIDRAKKQNIDINALLLERLDNSKGEQDDD